MNNKFSWIGGGVLVVAAFLGWLFWVSTRPLPGQKQVDEGRGHVQIGTEVPYKTNPPTSGQHYEDWTRSGIYSEPKDDRNLVHSLEHGYVIMHYKCTTPVIPSANEGSPANVGISDELRDSSPSAQNDKQQECDDRRAKLGEIYNKKGKRKLIVVPRPNMETNFALTAWDYLDKFDTMDSVRIEKFIDAHLDNGPERTME